MFIMTAGPKERTGLIPHPLIGYYVVKRDQSKRILLIIYLALLYEAWFAYEF